MARIIRRQLGVTRLSSKGQVVIPEEARKAMRLHEGETLLVATLPKEDMVVLKRMRLPAWEMELLRDKRFWSAVDNIRHGKLVSRRELEREWKKAQRA